MELTKSQLERQDFVDNSCYILLKDLAKGKYIEWDMEYIGEIRDLAQSIIVDELKLMTEQEFYPYEEI